LNAWLVQQKLPSWDIFYMTENGSFGGIMFVITPVLPA